MKKITDKMRLDWLTRSKGSMLFIETYRRRHGQWGGLNEKGWFINPRKAIDAAIRAESKPSRTPANRIGDKRED